MNAAIAVVIPTFGRTSILVETIRKVQRCLPRPQEILVHVDFGDVSTLTTLQEHFHDVRVISSSERQGPGGGRNKLIEVASQEIVVSLDDDSWPVDEDFFGRVVKRMERCPEVAVLACAIQEADSEQTMPVMLGPDDGPQSVHCFVGCGAVLRRSAFLVTSGYLPLQHAYGMEEADVSLQLIDSGYQILWCPELRVFHDCPREVHHASRQINHAHIVNTALLAFLRYPVRFLPFGSLQVMNRVIYCVRKRRFAGLVSGILSIPYVCWRFRNRRSPVAVGTIMKWLALKRLERES